MIMVALGTLGVGVSACATTPSPQAAAVVAPTVAAPEPVMAAQTVASAPSSTGTASWYRRNAVHHRTCTGRQLDDEGFTAASPVLPMGTEVRVARLDDDRSVDVLVDDCMPRGHRLIDVSVAAAKRLGLMSGGIAAVSVTPIILAENQ